MTSATPTPIPSATRARPAADRWFYPAVSLLLLLLTFIGFRYFYLEGKAFPARPLTPPIRGLLIAHGVLMTAWMLLAVAQPALVALRLTRWHRHLGGIGALLSAALVVVGIQVAVGAARVNPPDLRMFGLSGKQFMAIPFLSILVFGLYVLAGVLYRRKMPEAHRPLMLMASLSVVSAATGRMPALNAWYAGTWLETLFTTFLITLVLGALLLALKCALSRRFDRWFAAAFASLVLASAAISLLARTPLWDALATSLLG